MKKLLSNKFFLMAIAFVIGGASVWVITRHIDTKNRHEIPQMKPSGRESPDRFFDDFFNDAFFGRSRDPFEEMRRMQREIFKQFDEDRHLSGSFDRWYEGRFGGDSSEITQREDDQFLYYEINLKDHTPKEMKVEVRDSQITISGQIESKEEVAGTSRFYNSSFHRSFPIPPDVEADKYTMEQEDQKIIIKFPKKKTS